MSPPAVSARDRAFLRRAVRDHHAFVFRIAFSVVRRAADAEDVTQTTFLQLTRHASAQRRNDALRAWLATVAINTARQRLRSDSRRRAREESWSRTRAGWVEDEAMRAEDREQAGVVRAAVDALPWDLRIPLQLHYVEGLAYREIATVLDCPEGTVAKRMHLGRRELEKSLGPLQRNAAIAALPIERVVSIAQPSVSPVLESRLLTAIDRSWASGNAASGGNATRVAANGSRSWPMLMAVGLAVGVTSLALALTWNLSEVPAGRGAAHALLDLPADETPRSGARVASTVSASGGVTSTALSSEPTPDGRSALPDDDAASPPQPEESALETLPPDVRRPIAASSDPGSAVVGETLRVHGRVTDDQNTPIPGALVELTYAEEERGKSWETRSDDQGRYEFAIDLSGEHLIEFGDADTVPRTGSPTNDASAEGETESVDWARHKPPFLGQTMSISGGRVSLRVSASGHRTRRDGDYVFGRAMDLERNYALPTAHTIRGHVVNADGEPIVGARVRVMGGVGAAGMGFDELDDRDRETRTDAAGVFSFGALGSADYLVEASAIGWLPAHDVHGVDADEVRLTLQPAARLELTVEHRPTKKPVSGGRMVIYRDGWDVAGRETDRQGRATFDLPPGRYVAAIFRNDFAVWAEEIAVDRGAPTERRSVVDDGIRLVTRLPTAVRELSRSMRIHLRPVDTDATRAGVSVRSHSFALARGPHVATRFVGPDGVTVFEGLTPGRYRVEVFTTVQKGAIETRVVAQDIEIGPAPRTVDVELDGRDLALAHLTVDVRGPTGEALPSTRVLLIGDEVESGVVSMGAKTGSLELDVTPGRYRIQAEALGHRLRRIDGFDLRPNERR
ncbi:MAG: sigma-70 family RNA polymerase sigma factor, partial [Planctomycetes bacterium]|nr:sigma-70 family RNA polymerase sigma factor [Planctomycetota bacterium]